MIKQINISSDFNEEIASTILEAWGHEDIKVIHLINEEKPDDIRDFYEKKGCLIGEYKLLAEDVSLGDRSNQKANKIWMDVRYDSNIKDAYRHSSNPQPLHTDGSYNPDFPNATLMCCISNSASGGETIFLNLKKLVSILEEEDPELLNFLFTEEIIHQRTGYSQKKPILYNQNEKLKINFNYYCISKDNLPRSLEFIEKFFYFLNNSEKLKKYIDPVKLNVGDAVFWKDSETLHGRNGFAPKKNSERFLWKAAINIGR